MSDFNRFGGEQKKKSDWGSWAMIVFLFAVGAWFIALPLLFIKLFAPDDKRNQATPSLTGSFPRRETASPQETQTTARSAARKMTKSPAEKKSTARVLKIVGILLAAVGLYYAADPAGMVFAGYVQNFLWDMLKYLALSAGGVGMFLSGLSMDRAMKRYPRYLAVMGDQPSISFDELVRKLGYSQHRVITDLQKMIDLGYFGGQAYLDMGKCCFFRSGQAAEAASAQEQKEAAPAPKEADEGYSGILRNIRRANDEIADPVLSAKIDRLEEITAQIFKAVEEDPKKRSRIDTFMNYYLPTTQKLLDSYAKFESTGVEGENLRQAKERIQTTMDSIITGFEHQLDQLYQADVMDVDSDIRVMETMLNRDTASVEKDFGLGKGGSQPAAPGEVDLGGSAAQQLPNEN